MKVAMMQHCNAVVRQSVGGGGQSILATFPALAHFVHPQTLETLLPVYDLPSHLFSSSHSSLLSQFEPFLFLCRCRGREDAQTLGHTHRFKSAENKRN
ncbi:hypothetical protein WR25_09176 [Diploscapter pachys]|uniref:Uncharacterized protein n=1 Tax=Diploscapter pachys TaxID=2018661 RepID=A0A2A2LX57_9BILA|nr:hypothetical protein WR25_09176 [Diploscapter pachys]